MSSLIHSTAGGAYPGPPEVTLVSATKHSDTVEVPLSRPVAGQSGALVAAPSPGTLVTRAAAEYLAVIRRTITVPDDYPSSLLAVMHAGVSDTISVRPGEYQEHLTITRPLTLSALGDGVTISSVDPAVPIVMVDVSENYDDSVFINGIKFVGKYGMLAKAQTAVEIASGRCRLNECTFVGWYQLHDTYPAYELEDDAFDAYFLRRAPCAAVFCFAWPAVNALLAVWPGACAM